MKKTFQVIKHNTYRRPYKNNRNRDKVREYRMGTFNGSKRAA